MTEFRVYGPPGTGKTTRLATRDIPRAVNKFGPDRVVVTSFSRAAAREVSNKKSRDTGETIPVNPEHVGTTHSLCYHALGRPELVIKHIPEWNDRFPRYYIPPASLGAMDEGIKDNKESTMGNQPNYLHITDIYRAKMQPMDTWDRPSIEFMKEWSKFKKKKLIMDFTDLIEVCRDKHPYAPGSPSVIFVDEAQDFTKLQLSLVRSWGASAKWIVLVGDDDQCLYSFTGCDPMSLIHPKIPDKHKTVLSQSYRIPRAVHQKAMSIIKNVRTREPKEYKPKDLDGIVRMSMANFRAPETAIVEAEAYAKQGKTVMFLSTCDYMLNVLKKRLRERSLPFHNPYRMKRGDWNPLKSNMTGTSAKDLIINFSDHGMDDNYWNIPQFIKWAKFLKVGDEGLIRKVGKKAIKQLEQAVEENLPGLHTCREVLPQILSPVAVQKALDRNLNWLYDNLIGRRQTTMTYPISVYDRHGLDALSQTPKIIIGTIHSVKGGEADIVYLFPDISSAAEEEATTITGMDAIYRMFYVGITRAKEELIIAQPMGSKRKGMPSRAIQI